MRKDWKLILGVGVLIFFQIYWGVTNGVVFEMRHISLGRPDPALITIGLSAIALSLWLSLIARWQEKSPEIATNIGGICVHDLEPYVRFDPLDHMNITLEERQKLEDARSKCWTDKDYDSSLDILKPFGFWCDGGAEFLGWNGDRLQGRALLMVPEDMIIRHGKDAVCAASVETFRLNDQVENIPPEYLRFIRENIPRFKPGEFILAFGTQRHPKTVRAKVLRNENLDNNDVSMINPKWLWTFPIKITPIKADHRLTWIEGLTGKLKTDFGRNAEKLKFWKTYDEKVKEDSDVIDLTGGGT